MVRSSATGSSMPVRAARRRSFQRHRAGIQLRIVPTKRWPHRVTAIRDFVRKDLIDSGKVKTLKDLKGLKSRSPPGHGEFLRSRHGAEKGGLTYKDVSEVYLGFAEMVAAFRTAASMRAR